MIKDGSNGVYVVNPQLCCSGSISLSSLRRFGKEPRKMGGTQSATTADGDYTAAATCTRTSAGVWTDGDLDGTTVENLEDITVTPDTPLMVNRPVRVGEPLSVKLTGRMPKVLKADEVKTWIESPGSARWFAFNRKVCKAVTGLSGETLDLMTSAACIAAIVGVATYEITSEDDKAADGTPITPASHAEMTRVLNALKDTDNVPAADTKLLDARAYERMGHDMVGKAFELLNRVATVAYARAHPLWVCTRGHEESQWKLGPEMAW